MKDSNVKYLQSQMNPHFVFNTLNAIQYYISSNEKIVALKHISIFGKLIRYHINNLEKESVSLICEIEMIKWYFKLQNLRYNDRFEFHIAERSLKNNNSAEIPSYVLQTVFENIIETSVALNNNNNVIIKTDFEICSKRIIVKIDLKNTNLSLQKTVYQPIYRNTLLKWEEQIENLNSTKNYNITKKIKSLKDKNGNFNGFNISIDLPNLS